MLLQSKTSLVHSDPTFFAVPVSPIKLSTVQILQREDNIAEPLNTAEMLLRQPFSHGADHVPLLSLV
jgi:hypothetical protein